MQSHMQTTFWTTVLTSFLSFLSPFLSIESPAYPIVNLFQFKLLRVIGRGSFGKVNNNTTWRKVNDHSTVQLSRPFFLGVPFSYPFLPFFFSLARTPFEINCFSAGTGKELSKELWARSLPIPFYPSLSRFVITPRSFHAIQLCMSMGTFIIAYFCNLVLHSMDHSIQSKKEAMPYSSQKGYRVHVGRCCCLQPCSYSKQRKISFSPFHQSSDTIQ